MSTLCEDCQEPICPHGVCWCGDSDGWCETCQYQDEAEYQAEQNARYYAREDGETF